MKKTALNIIKRLVSARVLHYLIAGGCSFLIEYTVFLTLFYRFNFEPGVSSALGFLFGLVCSFVLNRFWVFKIRAQRATLQVLSFFALGFANLIITSVLVDLLVNWDVPGYIAKVGTMVIVVVWNFIIMKRLIFRQQLDI